MLPLLALPLTAAKGDSNALPGEADQKLRRGDGDEGSSSGRLDPVASILMQAESALSSADEMEESQFLEVARAILREISIVLRSSDLSPQQSVRLERAARRLQELKESKDSEATQMQESLLPPSPEQDDEEESQLQSGMTEVEDDEEEQEDLGPEG